MSKDTAAFELIGVPVASDEMQAIAYELTADDEYYKRIDAMTEEEALMDEIRHAVKDHPERSGHALAFMLDALVEALDADMEQGAAWMNDAAHAEFSRKYPRFTTLLSVARHVKWEEF